MQALYYPYIDVPEDAWLKSAILYWDKIYTIAPRSIDQPYSSEAARQLQALGYLEPYLVDFQDAYIDSSDFMDVHSRAQEALGRMDAGHDPNSWAQGLGDLPSRSIDHLRGVQRRLRRLAGDFPEFDLESELRRHVPIDRVTSLAHALSRGEFVHYQKLSLGFLERLRRESGWRPRADTPWILLPQSPAAFYMTLLASKISNKLGTTLVTDVPPAGTLASLATVERAGAPPLETSGFGEGLLVELVLQGIRIDPTTPLDVLLKFKKEHGDELGRLRTVVHEAAGELPALRDPQDLRRNIEDIHRNRIQPALSGLQQALSRVAIRYTLDGVIKTITLVSSSATVAGLLGVQGPYLMCAMAAGLSVAINFVQYRLDRSRVLDEGAFSYVLAAQRAFGRH